MCRSCVPTVLSPRTHPHRSIDQHTVVLRASYPVTCALCWACSMQWGVEPRALPDALHERLIARNRTGRARLDPAATNSTSIEKLDLPVSLLDPGVQLTVDPCRIVGSAAKLRNGDRRELSEFGPELTGHAG